MSFTILSLLVLSVPGIWEVGKRMMLTGFMSRYTLYAASAVGAGTVMRSLAGFGFPLFAPYLVGLFPPPLPSREAGPSSVFGADLG